MLALQTSLSPFFLGDLFLSLGAQKEVLSQVNLCVGGKKKKEQVFLSPLKCGPRPQRVLPHGLLSLTCFPSSPPLQQEQPESKQ